MLYPPPSRSSVVFSDRKDIQQGLFGWWSFDDDTGADNSGNQNHGTIGAACSSAAGAVPGYRGQAGAVKFGNATGVADVVSLSVSPFSKFPTEGSGTNWTMTAWIFVTTGSQNNGIYGSDTSGSVEFRVNGSNNLEFLKQATASLATSVATIPLNRWTHVALTFGGGSNYVFYINGAVDSSGSTAQTFVAATAYYLGGRGAAGENFAGSMDDMRVYSRPLGAAEVYALYALGVQPYGEDEWPCLLAPAAGTVIDTLGSAIIRPRLGNQWRWKHPKTMEHGNALL